MTCPDVRSENPAFALEGRESWALEARAIRFRDGLVAAAVEDAGA